MDQMQPDQLSPHRVYFTEFDRITFSQVAWTQDEVEEIKQNLTRKLKLLILTKGHIVIAVSHLLESEIAHDVIFSHPELISERIVIPALRDDYVSCEAFFEAKRESTSPGKAKLYKDDFQRDIAQFIDSEGLCVRWDPSKTSEWFKNKLIYDLKAENSLVNCHLIRIGLKVPEDIYDALNVSSSLSRGIVYSATKRYDNLMLRETINDYADFLYYLSGARAVHSEGVLPQENIIDFDIADLQNNRCPLSEHEVFFKIFINILKAFTSTHFPSDLLDALTIPDTVDLHHVAIKDDFVQKYNNIQVMTKDALDISDPERLVLHMQELITFEQDLHNQFMSAIDGELPIKLRQLRTSKLINLVHALANLILIPYGVLVGMKDIVISGLRVLNRDVLATDIQNRIDSGMDALKRYTGDAFDGEHPVLLHFVDKLKTEYIKRLTITGS